MRDHLHLKESIVKNLQLFRALLLALGCTLGASSSAQNSYRFSPVNQWDITKTASYWNPIINFVSKKSGVNLELKIGRTSADTTAYVLAEEVELVFSNHLFNPQRMKLGWEVFGRRNAPPIHAQIVARGDMNAPINLKDLDGTEMGFAGNEAFIGYKVPMAYLLTESVKVKTLFAGNQNGAFAQLFAGRVRAVGSNSMLVEGYAKREAKQFKVLWTSEGYYDLALMASKKVSPKDLKAISDAFFSMHLDPVGKGILEAASREVSLTAQDHFVPSSMKDYQNYVKFFQAAPSFLH